MIRTQTLLFLVIFIVLSNAQSAGECPDGRPAVNCLIEPCRAPAPENCEYSVCVNDYCGGCNRRYYAQNGSLVCTSECVTVNCLVEPCSLPSPPLCDYDYCVNDYCGGCFRHYYTQANFEVCTEQPCSNGTQIANCSVEPCSLPPPPSCNYTYCVNDYCGGCFRRYFDEDSRQVCESSEPSEPPSTLCPDGTEPTECLIEPCAEEPPENCQYSYCVNDYCGGCFRHYFDEDNRPVCNEDIVTCLSNDDCTNGKFCSKENNSCSSTGVCEDPPVFCTREFRPVCGCDGRNYSNPCIAKSNRVNIAFFGACQIDIPCSSDSECISANPSLSVFCQSPVGQCSGNGTCRQRNPICTEQYQPVCGCDGNTYGNLCFAYAAGVNVNRSGRCDITCSSSLECSTSEFCQFSSGQCFGNGTCTSKPEGCIALYDPVCGCDGNTYSNDCEASVAGVSVARSGNCSTSSCSSNRDCSRSEYCQFPSGQCSGSGTCTSRPEACIALYDPVCGCDGNTYSNDCEASVAGVSVVRSGTCSTSCSSNRDCSRSEYCQFPSGQCSGNGTCTFRPEACIALYDPVCGCDGNIYSNDCEASVAGVGVVRSGTCSTSSCSSNRDCSRSEYCQFPSGQCSGSGNCTSRPEACIALYDPVCGCDGNTYSNDCEASVAGVSVSLNAECPAGTCTSSSNCGPYEFCLFSDGQCSGVGVCSGRGTFLCNRNPTPVCGCNGKTYSDPCKALNRGINIQSQGRCPLTCRTNKDCCRRKNTFCSKPAGNCTDVGSCQVIPEICYDLYNPVCGCDGKTYSNECYAQRGKANVANSGPCL